MFVDLQETFDNIPISKLFEVLENTNINHYVTNAVQNVYKRMKSSATRK